MLALQHIVAGLIAAACASTALAQSRIADPQFGTRVERPAYAANGPTVVID